VNQPPSEQEESDLREVIAVLGSGHFTTGQIHRAHMAAVARHGRQPMHLIRLGQVLREYGAISKPKWDGTKKRKPGYRPGFMVKGWII
jgi:hypothetical protein